jgi:hypothetical protein
LCLGTAILLPCPHLLTENDAEETPISTVRYDPAPHTNSGICSVIQEELYADAKLQVQ